jgi:uncharacterized protein YbaR (Trm112 family)
MASDIYVLCLGHFLLTKPSQRTFVPTEPVRRADAQLSDVWCSPNAQGAMRVEQDHLACADSGQTFPITDGIPQLFWPHESFNSSSDVTKIVKAFYEETPFPNYDEHDSLRSLIEKSRRGLYARVLDESIPYNVDVLEVGCGTGQLTNFPARTKRGRTPAPCLASEASSMTRRGSMPSIWRSLDRVLA